jgi:hypothetical protein
MNLYIEIENNQPKNHPAFEDNLKQAFGEIPENWQPFIRIERPILGVYELLENQEAIYAKVDDVWSDVWTVRDMTTEEKIAKQQAVITSHNTFEQAENWSAWIFDEVTCTMKPPIPRPEPIEGKLVFWCGADANWKEAPIRPEGQYKFDFFAWNWVAI